MAEWLAFTKEFGIPGAALVWIAWYIIMPIKDGHLNFLKKTSETQEKLTETIEKQAEIMSAVLSNQNKIVAAQEKMAEDIEKVTTIVEKINSK
jgi:predicted PurR-regulated permease PerM